MNKNNFDSVRIFLAIIVMMAHAAILTQAVEFKLIEKVFDSNFAVKGFFSISGFLVAKSYVNSRTWLDYAEKRFRRIYPAYATSIMFCLAVGGFVTTASALNFATSIQTIKYVIANLTFLNFIQPTLPGVFGDNYNHALNGALWTIKVEVMLYLCVPFLVWLFQRIGSVNAALLTFFGSTAWVCFFGLVYSGGNGDEIARQFPGQLSYFVFGALFALNERVLRQSKRIAIVSFLALFLPSTPIVKMIIDPIVYSSIIIFLSTGACRTLEVGKVGDISYGIYLYHFPVIQLLIYMEFFKTNPWFGLLATSFITILLALVSWHFVEKKFLRRTSHYVEAFRTKRIS